MKNENGEKEIRHLFQSMRTEDLKNVPAFENIASGFSTQKTKAVHAPSFYLALAASGMIIILAALLFYASWNSSPAPVEDLDKWASLSSWDATTDAILTISGTQVDDIFSAATDTWLEKSVTSETN